MEIDLSQVLTSKEDEAKALIAEYCTINLQDLETAMVNQPGLYSYVYASWEICRAKEAQAKWDLDAEKSHAFARAQAAEPKATMTALEKRILVDAVVEQKRFALLALQLQVARLRGLLGGLEHRKDMLVQLAAKARAELSSLG